MDRITKAQRSRLMATIGPKNTGPELLVRSLLHRMGFRFRLHRRDLPGTPDIVLPGRAAVVFVNGCFWHGHRCKMGKMPKSRQDYWEPKIAATKLRDAKKKRQLQRLGWRPLVVWECELRQEPKLAKKLRSFLKLRSKG